MAKVDLLIYPVAVEIIYPHDEKYAELVKKLSEVEPPNYYTLYAEKGPVEVAREIEERLKRLGLPYIAIRGLEPSSDKTEEEVIEAADSALRHKFEKIYGIKLVGTRVLRVPRYEEWKDPPEDSTLDWLWLAVGVAGAIALPLLYAALKR